LVLAGEGGSLWTGEEESTQQGRGGYAAESSRRESEIPG